ncbi:hypothetical protein Tco_1306429 [Tanacetum coccineum]
MTVIVVNNLVFRTFFEKEKLTGPKFIGWYRNLRIVLSVEDKLTYLARNSCKCPCCSRTSKEYGTAYMTCLRRKLCFLNRQNMNFFKLQFPSKEYDGFVQNYNMQDMGKTVIELHAMLKLHEQTLPKKHDAHALHSNRASRI